MSFVLFFVTVSIIVYIVQKLLTRYNFAKPVDYPNVALHQIIYKNK